MPPPDTRVRRVIATGEILRPTPDRDVTPPEPDAYSAEDTWRERPPPRVDAFVDEDLEDDLEGDEEHEP